MNVRGTPAPSLYLPVTYWEDRAQRFAAEGEGLAAVCSYGMPEFYNRVIDYCQWLALRRWLDIPPGTRVLDVGCGVGRWSRRLAARGAQVTGIASLRQSWFQAQAVAAPEALAASAGHCGDHRRECVVVAHRCTVRPSRREPVLARGFRAGTGRP